MRQGRRYENHISGFKLYCGDPENRIRQEMNQDAASAFRQGRIFFMQRKNGETGEKTFLRGAAGIKNPRRHMRAACLTGDRECLKYKGSSLPYARFLQVIP